MSFSSITAANEREVKPSEKNHKSISRLFALNISHFSTSLLSFSHYFTFFFFFHNQHTTRVTQPATVAAATTAIVKLFSLSHKYVYFLYPPAVSSHHPSTVRNENSLASRFLSTLHFRTRGESSRIPQDALIYDKFDDTTAKAIFFLLPSLNKQQAALSTHLRGFTGA